MTTTQSSDAGVNAETLQPAKAGQDGGSPCLAGSAPASLPAFRRRALAILREGRVSVCRATDDEDHTPNRVMAFVTSSRSAQVRYLVELGAALPGWERVWSCTCRAGMRDEPCAHVHAVKLVTTGAGS